MRSTAHLPSLAGLRLGGTADVAPTGMEAPAARRRRVDGPPAPLPSPPLRLTGLPRDVIDVMVTQAALSARSAEDPAQAICEWMGQFCKAAKVQGVAGCDDRWYMLALQAFGVPLMNEKPAYMEHEWRVLFGQVCEALNETRRIHSMRPGYFKWNAPQREMDEALSDIFAGWKAKRMMTLERHGHNAEGADSNHEQEFKQVVEDWMAGRDQKNRTKKPSKSKALAAMLLLKGAQPWTEAKYKGEEYATLDMAAVNAVQNLRNGRISAAEALVALRQALDSGASLYAPEQVVQGSISYGSLMYVAAKTEDADIINLLLDRGWVVDSRMKFGGEATDHSRFLEYLLRVTARVDNSPAWPVDLATSKRLIRAAALPWALALYPYAVSRLGMELGYVWNLLSNNHGYHFFPFPGSEGTTDLSMLEFWGSVTGYYNNPWGSPPELHQYPAGGDNVDEDALDLWRSVGNRPLL